MLKGKNIIILLIVLVALFSCGAKKKPAAEASPASSASASDSATDTASDANAAASADIVKPEHIVISGNQISVRDGDGKVKSISPVVPSNTPEEVAYALAMQTVGNIRGIYSEVYGREIKQAPTDSEMGAFLQGVLDAYSGQEIEYEYFMEIGNKLKADSDAAVAKLAEEAKGYFETLATRPGIIKTNSGLMYEIVSEGTGNGGITESSKVNVDYVMSVYKKGEPNDMVQADKNEGIEFRVSNLIPGAIEGIKLMKEGAEYIFYINPELGYGPVAVSPVIGPNSYLIFKVKVNKIVVEEKAVAPAAQEPVQEPAQEPVQESAN